jgi:hypothetical protein
MTSFRFQVDNDWFDFWQRSVDRPDENYTAGQGFRLLFDAAPGWMRFGTIRLRRRATSVSSNRLRADCPSASCSTSGTQRTILPCLCRSSDRTQDSFLANSARSSVKPKILHTLGIRVGTTGKISEPKPRRKLFTAWPIFADRRAGTIR